MINLVTMAGKGKRFSDEGYLLPKPLIQIDGEPMIWKVIDCLPKASKWIFIVRQEHIDDYSIDIRDTKLGPCDHFRDYIYVMDVVEGIIQSRSINNSCTINFGIGSFIKVKDFVTIFWEKLGGDMTKLKFGFQPMLKYEPDQPKSYADLTRLYELTQWKPTYSIEKGIEATIDGLLKEAKDKLITN